MVEAGSALLPEELVQSFPGLRIEGAQRAWSLLHRTGKLPSEYNGIRKDVYARLREHLVWPRMELLEERKSRLDPFVKYAFLTEDQQRVEAVRIPLEHPGRVIVCVSSQVGCAMGCSFCGTGRLGLRRSLSALEILAQVRHVKARLPAGMRVHGVAFQGMGEPLANLTEVWRATCLLSAPYALAIDHRNVTLCTAGLAPELERMVELAPKLRYALSIGSARPEKRALLIPLSKRYPLSESLAILAEHARRVRIAPLLVYTLLADTNDGEEELEALVGLVKGFVRQSGLVPRVTLVEYSPLGQADSYRRAELSRLCHFRSVLGAEGIPVTRRYSGGADVGAACGQLGLGGPLAD